MTRIYESARPAPSHLILEDYRSDTELGMLKAGKEAEVWVLERTANDGRTCLLADKRYIPPEQRAFKADIAYRAHRRSDGLARDRGGALRARAGGRARQLAMDQRTAYGRKELHKQWVSTEFAMLQRLWDAGAPVPYAIATDGASIVMEYIGDHDGAAPRLAQLRTERNEMATLAEQARDALLGFARAGIVHADLSAYNVLVWRERTVVIDLPQAVPFLGNTAATEFLHRDCVNLFGWFARKGVDIDPEEVFVDALNVLFDYEMEDLFHAHGG